MRENCPAEPRRRRKILVHTRRLGLPLPSRSKPDASPFAPSSDRAALPDERARGRRRRFPRRLVRRLRREHRAAERGGSGRIDELRDAAVRGRRLPGFLGVDRRSRGGQPLLAERLALHRSRHDGRGAPGRRRLDVLRHRAGRRCAALGRHLRDRAAGERLSRRAVRHRGRPGDRDGVRSRIPGLGRLAERATEPADPRL